MRIHILSYPRRYQPPLWAFERARDFRILMRISSFGRDCPAASLSVQRFERSNSSTIAFGQIDVIPAVEQLIAADRIDRERNAHLCAADRLLLEINYYLLLWIGGHQGRELGNIVFGQDCRQQTVLDGILRKDVAEGRRDDAAESVIVNGVDGGFARRAATEIATGKQYLGVGGRRLVEWKVGAFVTISVAAPVLEQHTPEALRTRPLEIPRWQDLIGVEVRQHQWAGFGGEVHEFLHVAGPIALVQRCA